MLAENGKHHLDHRYTVAKKKSPHARLARRAEFRVEAKHPVSDAPRNEAKGILPRVRKVSEPAPCKGHADVRRLCIISAEVALTSARCVVLPLDPCPSLRYRALSRPLLLLTKVAN